MTIALATEVTPARFDILALALRALREPSMVVALGDAVQEAKWFDSRVMRLMWPIGCGPHSDRPHSSGYPALFRGVASRPTLLWARAIVAVLLFGGWQKRPWRAVRRVKLKGLGLVRNVRFYFDGVEIPMDVIDLRYTKHRGAVP